MKYILSTVVLLALMLTGCKKDETKATLLGMKEPLLTATNADIVISKANAEEVVFTAFWERNNLTTNVDGVGVPNSTATYTFQAAADASFTTTFEAVYNESSIEYTGEFINVLALNRLGLEPDVRSEIFFRIMVSYGANVDIKYSNTVSVGVTPTILNDDSDILWMPSKESSFTDFSVRLWSPNKDGKFEGVVYALGWWNFRFYTTNNPATADIYGSDPNNAPYGLYSGSDAWDIWFDYANADVYWVTANMNTMTWTPKSIKLTLTGEFNGWNTGDTEFTYDPTTKTFRIENLEMSNVDWGVQVLVNEDWGFFFGDLDGKLVSNANGGGNITVAGGVGNYTIVLDMNNPKEMTYTFTKN